MTRTSRRFQRQLAVLAIIAGLALAACLIFEARRSPAAQLAPNSTLWTAEYPPIRYQANATVTISTDTPAGVRARCKAAGLVEPEGWSIAACRIHTGADWRIILPRPDLVDAETFKRLFTHEVGHALGWPGTHGE